MESPGDESVGPEQFWHCRLRRSLLDTDPFNAGADPHAARKCDALEVQLGALLQQFDTTLITIPGIGAILAATILSEIGDISRFSSADKLAAYIGVDPAVNQSGEFVGTYIHMSKRGSPYLRRTVRIASVGAVQRNPMFMAYYEKKAAEGLRYMSIIGHVAKKMTAVIYTIMRDKKAYVPVMPVVA